jgi:hypothetical protein
MTGLNLLSSLLHEETLHHLDSDHDKMRLTVSNNNLKDREFFRGYKTLQSSNHPETEVVYRKIKELHPQRPDNSNFPNLPDNLLDLENTTAEVKSIVVGKTENSVTN